MAVQISGDSLAIILEYAYHGEAKLGGTCRNLREEGCPLCDAFSEAEALLPEDAPLEREA